MKIIQVIETATGEVVKQYKLQNQKQIDATLFYLDAQMNHEKYRINQIDE